MQAYFCFLFPFSMIDFLWYFVCVCVSVCLGWNEKQMGMHVPGRYEIAYLTFRYVHGSIIDFSEDCSNSTILPDVFLGNSTINALKYQKELSMLENISISFLLCLGIFLAVYHFGHCIWPFFISSSQIHQIMNKDIFSLCKMEIIISGMLRITVTCLSCKEIKAARLITSSEGHVWL